MDSVERVFFIIFKFKGVPCFFGSESCVLYVKEMGPIFAIRAHLKSKYLGCTFGEFRFSGLACDAYLLYYFGPGKFKLEPLRILR